MGRTLKPILFCLTILTLSVTPAGASLRLAIEVDPDPPEPGERLDVRLTVTNPGGTASGAVTLSMPWPDHLFSLSDSLISNGGGCPGTTCDSLETVTWALGTLPPGGGITVFLPPVVRSDGGAPPDGTAIDFTAEVFESGVSRATAGRTVISRTQRVLELAIDESRDPAPAGGLLTYVVTYGNRSSTTTTGTVLRFPLPAGNPLVAVSDGGTLQGSAVVWNLGTLTGHEGGQRKVTVRVDAGQPEAKLLAAAAATLTGDGDFLTHQTRTRPVTRVENSTPLQLALEAAPDPARPGEMLQTELTVANRGATFLTNVVLELFYPTELFSLSDSLISDGGGCSGTTCDAGEILTWFLGTLPPGRGLTVALPPSVRADAPGGTLVPLRAEVSEDGGTNAQATQTLVVRSDRVLGLRVDEDRDPVARLGELTYVLTYGNRSATTTTGNQLRFPLPVGGTLISASGGGTQVGSEVVWNLGTLAGHEGGRREVTLRLGGGLGEGTLVEIVAATLEGVGAFLRHETRDRVVTRVENATPLQLALAVNPDPPEPGEMLQAELTVANRGTVFLDGVTLQLRYPAHLSSLSDSLLTDGGGCPGTTCDPGETVTWFLGTLPPGRGVTVALPPALRTAATVPGGSLVPLAAEVFEDGGTSASAAQTLLTRDERVLGLMVDESHDPAAAGNALTYVLTYGNRSANPTSNTVMRFPLPAGTSFLTATGLPSHEAGALSWNLGTLGAHSGGRRTVTVRLDGGLAEGTVLEIDAATLTGSGPFLGQQGRARAATRVENSGPLTLDFGTTPDPALPGDVLSTDLTVRNTSGAFLFGTTLQLRYPAELFSLDEDLVTGAASCPGTTCDSGELVTWDLGDLPPAATASVSLPPTVRTGGSAPPEGELILFWAQAFSDSFGEAVTTRSLLTADELTEGVMPIFTDGFESGDLSAWSSSVP